VLATVSSYLVVIASGLVRDIYQRLLRPNATVREMKLLSYGVMIAVGAFALAANIQPVQYLQALVVFSGTGAAATFLVPLIFAVYWRRTTLAGVFAALLAGAGTTLSLYAVGIRWGLLGWDPGIGPMTRFRPYYLLGFDPIIWAVLASAVTGIVVSLVTRPPREELLQRLFGSANEG
jgi:SSS family solute:Na+ symporter/sodium/pantothenate symporter